MLGKRLSTRHLLVCGIPQGVILSLVLFNIYVCLFTQLMQRFRLGCQQYTDYTQLYMLMGSWLDTTPANLIESLETCGGKVDAEPGESASNKIGSSVAGSGGLRS